ncbi:MAG: cysteine synthase A [Epsilonproteobacteria bacterium]|nr:cysteine synthase A [Campylobacterota bacterium]OIO16063.1 MAG: cysteine synthase A [Helicobacteraceae bacterium CG1_02_36_14]PIP10225.1 MAG: cysteine synthase A [Sulfurimonas sp. CG23_combo_of_CG06-09_8_20_14_all_36_33]PIS26455.1 MAG: cysteine synthase A [Sulfurimonas sp. CG08_land_8_20_14_0_20_36_33]PIU33917.1 MAG: cysteine synthase A [Sulfurimonas sp. CG07_land_8_20_14_0_80_36_56]PIV03745.1 MAG: cysteine synthase A [Sulfurimonas sp. CG03_land_8_20_14_0_80_36_25]PIV34111.1 MAG: cysteine 
MKVASNITELIGNTPLIKLKQETNETTLLGKCEFMNPSGSVKDRIGSNMILQALGRGEINENSVLIEPTSGNTGIALASIAANLGLKLVLTMPSSMSIERRRLLVALGAEIVLTEPAKGMAGAVAKAVELSQTTPNAVLLQQFENSDNPEVHRQTTAQEIWRDTDGKVDIFVAAIGTGGTITGVGEVLKQYNKDIQIIAVEPEASPVLSGGAPGPHKIQGIGAGFIPKVLNTEVYDEIIQISNDEAFQTAREIAKKEGLLVGISAGSNVAAAYKIAARPENRGKTIVTILCDTGERYLSTELYEYPSEN